MMSALVMVGYIDISDHHCCQLVLSVIVHAMKRQSCILNEDARGCTLLCGGKERHHRATVEVSIMFRPGPPFSLGPSLGANCISVDETKRTKDRRGKQDKSLQNHYIHRLPGNPLLLPRHQQRKQWNRKMRE